MRNITFGNKYKATLIDNDWEQTKVARLYTPDDNYIAGIYCTEEAFPVVAEALLNGYFAGWRDCKTAIKQAVTKAVDIDFNRME